MKTSTLSATLSAGAMTSALVVIAAGSVAAQTLPAIKASPTNVVPGCATPGRLMAYLKARNPQLDPRHEAIAVHYMQQGEELGLRWDVAFFQMIVETRSLEYRRSTGEPATVRPQQNNFAGIGATGGGNPGESFPDIAMGVRAHLQHVQMYGGDRVTAPVAERTRKVQDWGTLLAWQKTVTGPISYTDLARYWAPGDRSYLAGIDAVGRRFYEHFCNVPDPAPMLLSEVRGRRAVAARAPERAPSAGVELAQQAIDRARVAEDTSRSALGAGPAEPARALLRAAAAPVDSRPVAQPFRLLNAQPLQPATVAPPVEVAASSPATSPAVVVGGAERGTQLVSLDSNPADEAIAGLVSGKTFLLDTPIGSVIPINFKEDGTMTAKVNSATIAGVLGAASDSGKWWVEKAKLCQRWKVWFDKENQCLKLRQAGSTIHWLRDDGKSGTARISSR